MVDYLAKHRKFLISRLSTEIAIQTVGSVIPSDEVKSIELTGAIWKQVCRQN